VKLCIFNGTTALFRKAFGRFRLNLAQALTPGKKNWHFSL